MSSPHSPDAPLRQSEALLVVQVVRQYAPNRGGLEDVVANLSTQLLKRGYRVRIVTLDRQFRALARRLPATEILNGVEIIRIPFAGSTRYPFAPSVFRHIRDADIIHVHGIDFFFDALAWGWLLHRKTLIATTHGGFFHTPKYATLKRIWFNTLTRLSSTAYRYLIGCGRQDMLAFRAIAGHRVVQIDNGINIAKFSSASSASVTRRLMTLGRFSLNKGLTRLLDAMETLVAQEPQWHLDIVGIVSDYNVADLNEMIARHGLKGNVDVHTDLTDAQIKAIMENCSFFVSASEYEGFGLAAVEAMSAGLMPLLNPNAAYCELASNHSEIRLCNFTSREEAAATIQRCFSELSSDVTGYRVNAINAANTYSWETVGERYASLYREVLGLVGDAAFMSSQAGARNKIESA